MFVSMLYIKHVLNVNIRAASWGNLSSFLSLVVVVVAVVVCLFICICEKQKRRSICTSELSDKYLICSLL